MERLLHPWRAGLWPSLVHTVLDMPIGVLAFIPAVVLSAVMLGAAIVVPIALVTLALLLTWTHVVGTVERRRIPAHLVNDAHLAALAIEHGATLVSFDRDFGRFDGLRHRVPG